MWGGHAGGGILHARRKNLKGAEKDEKKGKKALDTKKPLGRCRKLKEGFKRR